ncbi:MAG: 2-amino-4-hydroxy-6-hydroxymethyldihydropteridine diphosphokinase [Firmicutes bacterium]|nr:2-amino-4-hydroxy-6-hydroxymethyldihydropteridine diphosphokinase [Bacillota bacterium]
MKTIVSIGSNMGDRRGYIDQALQQIEQKAGHILAVSDIIETKAYGLTEQEDFLNLAISLETQLQPRQLLDVFHEIEADLDRVRIIRWGPRTIDLDIIFYEDLILDEEDLHIPHIDFANRTFVLEPVCQIEPDLVDPRTGNTVTELLDELRQRKETVHEMD